MEWPTLKVRDLSTEKGERSDNLRPKPEINNQDLSDGQRQVYRQRQVYIDRDKCIDRDSCIDGDRGIDRDMYIDRDRNKNRERNDRKGGRK